MNGVVINPAVRTLPTTWQCSPNKVNVFPANPGELVLAKNSESVHLLLRFCRLPSFHSHLPFWTFPSTYWGALFPTALGVSVPAVRAGGSHPPELSASFSVLVSLDSCFMNPLKGAGVVLKEIHF